MLSAIEPTRFPWLDYKKYSFSLGLTSPAGAFLSGATASAFDGERVVVAGGMAQQARLAWTKIETVLEAAGQSLEDVTRVVEYVPAHALEMYQEAAAVRVEVLGGREICVNTVPLRRLLREDALIEIEATTVGKPSDVSAGLIHLPTILPLKDGEICYPGDVVGQTARIFEIADEMLTAMGSDLSHVVQTTDFLVREARKDYRASGQPRFERLGPVYPGAAGIMQPKLLHPEAMVQYDMIASRDTPERIHVPGWDRYNSLSYSAGVKAGKLIFGSGFGSMNPATEAVFHEGDIAAQADLIYSSIATMLAVGGAKMADVVKTVEFIEEPFIADYRKVAGVREKWFGKPFPGATGVVAEGILKREMVIEIIPVAVISE